MCSPPCSSMVRPADYQQHFQHQQSLTQRRRWPVINLSFRSAVFPTVHDCQVWATLTSATAVLVWLTFDILGPADRIMGAWEEWMRAGANLKLCK